MARILVVDDSAADRQLIGGLLEVHDELEVQYAANGAEALLHFTEQPPDLVVTDLLMPQMSGLELVQAVRKNYSWVPVIIVTSRGNEEVAVEALQQGAASYVPKRVLGDKLSDTVQQVLSISHEERNQARVLRRVTQSEVRLVLENDLTLFPGVVRLLQKSTAEMFICRNSDAIQLGVALEEALMNAYFHGNLELSSAMRESDSEGYYELASQRSSQPPFLNRRIHVEARFTPSEAVFKIRDEGAGFDHGAIPDPTDPANLDRPYGRGVLLMNAFMDQVRYNDLGNVVTLVKQRALLPVSKTG